MTARAGIFTVRTCQPARRVRTVLLGALVITGVTLGLGSCTSGSSGLPTQFSDAVGAMQAASGYSFTASIATGASTTPSVSVVGDFQAPDRVAQSVTRAASSPVTMVLDGGTVHVKDPATGTWSTQPSSATSTVDLRGAFAALARTSDVRVDGSTATFDVTGDEAKTLAGRDATGKVTVSITLGPVGLSRLAYRATVGGQPITVQLDYTNVGTAPAVTVPA